MPNITATLLGADLGDLNAALLIQNDDHNYLFNCPAGTQRFLNEHKLKMSKLKGIFFSSYSCRTTSGFTGMCFTLSDQKKDRTTINLYGPSSESFTTLLTHLDRCWNGTWERSPTSIHFKSKRIRVTSIPLPMPANTYPHVPSHPQAFGGYTMHFPTLPGKFNGALASQLGIKGKDRGMICKGHSVTLPDGTVVAPSMLIAPGADVGSVYFITGWPSSHSSMIDDRIHSRDRVPHCASSDLLQRFFAQRELIPVPGTAFLPCHMAETPYGIKWMELAAVNGMDVIVYGRSMKTPLSSSSYSFRACAIRRALVAEHVPSLLPALWSGRSLTAEEEAQADSDSLRREERLAFPLTRVRLAPIARTGVDRGLCHLTTAAIRQYAVDRHINTTPLSTIPPFTHHGVDSHQVCLHVLGSGSAMPSKYRNVTCYVLECFGRYVVVDAGEGSLGQMMRLFGPQRLLTEVLPNITHVMITHSHADHFLGVWELLATRSKVLALHASTSLSPDTRPVTLMGCPATLGYLRAEDHVDSYGPCVWVDIYESKMLSHISPLDHHPGSAFMPFPVPHIPDSMGYAFALPEGHLVVLSGDGRPDTPISTAIDMMADYMCANSGVGVSQSNLVTPQSLKLWLVHEASFGPGFEEEAAARGHSTVEEAVRCGRDLTADIIILTHFSQRFPKLPPVLDDDSLKAESIIPPVRFRIPRRRKVLFAEDCVTVTEQNASAFIEATRLQTIVFKEDE
eukprot:gnl/Dysnectes_brevis/1710_a1945_2138.p1 GENE.gnl/Dysnectes_brevis/1710_a1945_2138~~gnl/Dysnectes_brevis/1710_a1945_2138.p1  ORF type:complete len:736 (-),score=147.90 gnl/Dysnectes_brevis/1710_a1945_2138:46-2253(-)